LRPGKSSSPVWRGEFRLEHESARPEDAEVAAEPEDEQNDVQQDPPAVDMYGRNGNTDPL
jgi:hypothetical protein